MVIVHNLYCVNLSNFYLWQYDATTKQVMSTIDLRTKEAKEFAGVKYNIGINWMFEPSVNYYILTRKMTQLNLGNRLGPDNFYDFYYFLPEDKQIMDKYHLKAIKTFEPFPGILAKS